MGPSEYVYLNGKFCRTEDAVISPFDRGFLFAHAAYEVTAVFDGRLIDFAGHVARLQRTLSGIDIFTDWTDEQLEHVHMELIRRNQLTEGFIYFQVTGGAYGNRDFSGPETLMASAFLFCEQRQLIGEKARDGVAAILVEDQRWKRRDFKTTQLLSQALAYRDAARAGATSAILFENGFVTEAASANLWVVTADGTLVTRNLGHEILPGVTRLAVLGRLAGSGIAVEERAVSLDEIRKAREVFTTAATSLVIPVVTLDGNPVGNGAPGPVTRRVQALYYRAIGAQLGMHAPWVTETSSGTPC